MHLVAGFKQPRRLCLIFAMNKPFPLRCFERSAVQEMRARSDWAFAKHLSDEEFHLECDCLEMRSLIIVHAWRNLIETIKSELGFGSKK